MILLNGESLAYLGDAIYELEIRKYLLNTTHITDVNKLHKEAIKFTSGASQAKIMLHFLEMNFLNEEELSFYKRGRNSNHSKNRRNISVQAYKMATGFEALIGYLYLNNLKEGITEVIKEAIKYIMEG